MELAIEKNKKTVQIDIELLDDNRFKAVSQPGKLVEREVTIPADNWSNYLNMLISSEGVRKGEEFDVLLGEIKNGERVRKALVNGLHGEKGVVLSPKMDDVRFDFENLYIGGISPIFKGGQGYMTRTAADLNNLPESLKEETRYIRLDQVQGHDQKDCVSENNQLFMALNNANISAAITEDSVRIHTRAGTLGIDRAMFPDETESQRFELLRDVSPKSLRVLPLNDKETGFFHERFESAGVEAGFHMKNEQSVDYSGDWTAYPEREKPASIALAKHLSEPDLKSMMKNAYEGRILKMGLAMGEDLETRVYNFSRLLEYGTNTPTQRKELVEGMLVLSGAELGDDTTKYAESLLSDYNEMLKEIRGEVEPENESKFNAIVDDVTVNLDKKLHDLEGVEPVQRTLSRSV